MRAQPEERAGQDRPVSGRAWSERPIEGGAREDARGGAATLSRAPSEVPVAVLVVDREAGVVVHANPRARDLAPEATLPAPLDAWADAAHLCDERGARLAGPGSPLARVAAGEAVHGEPVTIAHPDAPPRTLLATGLPLEEAPELADRALLALLPLEASADHAAAPTEGADLATLRERALLATDVSFTISDARRPDSPLVWVNPAFTRTTGYAFDEAVGRNCRFLQGPDTDPEAIAEIRRATEAGEPVNVTLLNYRRDGSGFWNELTLTPVFDHDGTLAHYIGVQSDVTDRVRAERERERAYEAERAARAEAEDAREKLSLLAEATQLLSDTLDVGVALQRLAALSVPDLADWCVIDLVEGTDPTTVRRVAMYHGEDGADTALELERHLQQRASARHGPIQRVLERPEPLLLRDLTPEELEALLTGDDAATLAEHLGGHTAVLVPLEARRTLIGVLTLVMAAPERDLTEPDLDLVVDLAARAALAVDNARLYTREHTVAERLQHSLLPELATDGVPGVDVCARYHASGSGMEVGGDWYDLLRLPDGTLGVSIGDVMGHDLGAATAMGQLRSLLRAQAWERERPAEVLDRTDRLMQGLEVATLATAWFGRLEGLARGGEDGAPAPRVTLRYADAGHLPPVLRTPDGTTSFLDGASSLLLGAPGAEERPEAAIGLPPGSLLLLYTDGLIERRGASLADGLAWLRAEVASLPGQPGCEDLTGHLLAEVSDEALVDDVALLSLRVH